MATKTGELIKGAFRGAVVDLIAEHYGEAGRMVLEMGEAGPRELLAAMEKGYGVFIDAVEDMLLRTGELLEGCPVELITSEPWLTPSFFGIVVGKGVIQAGTVGVVVSVINLYSAGKKAVIKTEDGQTAIVNYANLRRKKETKPKTSEPEKTERPRPQAGPVVFEEVLGVPVVQTLDVAAAKKALEDNETTLRKIWDAFAPTKARVQSVSDWIRSVIKFAEWYQAARDAGALKFEPKRQGEAPQTEPPFRLRAMPSTAGEVRGVEIVDNKTGEVSTIRYFVHPLAVADFPGPLMSSAEVAAEAAECLRQAPQAAPAASSPCNARERLEEFDRVESAYRSIRDYVPRIAGTVPCSRSGAEAVETLNQYFKKEREWLQSEADDEAKLYGFDSHDDRQ